MGANVYQNELERIDQRRAKEKASRHEQAVAEWELTKPKIPTTALSAGDVLMATLRYLFPVNRQYRWQLQCPVPLWQLNRCLASLGMTLIALPPLSDQDEAYAVPCAIDAGVFADMCSFRLEASVAPTAAADTPDYLALIHLLFRHLPSRPLRGVGVLPLHAINAMLAGYAEAHGSLTETLALEGHVTIMGHAPTFLAMVAPGRVEAYALIEATTVNYSPSPPPEEEDC
jgi:hypothetical protein